MIQDCWWNDGALIKLFSVTAHWVWFDFAHIFSSFVSRLLLQHLPCVWRQLRRLKWYVFVIFDIMVVILLFWFSNAWRWWCAWCGDDGSALDCDVSRHVASYVTVACAAWCWWLQCLLWGCLVMQLRDAFLMPMLCSILRCFPCKWFHVKWWLRDDCDVVAAFCCCFFDYWICEAWPPFFCLKVFACLLLFVILFIFLFIVYLSGEKILRLSHLRSVRNLFHLIKFDKKLKICEDYIVYLEMAKNNKVFVVYFNKVFVVFE